MTYAIIGLIVIVWLRIGYFKARRWWWYHLDKARNDERYTQ